MQSYVMILATPKSHTVYGVSLSFPILAYDPSLYGAEDKRQILLSYYEQFKSSLTERYGSPYDMTKDGDWHKNCIWKANDGRIDMKIFENNQSSGDSYVVLSVSYFDEEAVDLQKKEAGADW